MEDFAYCVRLWDAKLGYEKKDGKYVQRLPRCHGEVAMADAIIALTANRAMHERKRIEFPKRLVRGGIDGSAGRSEFAPKVPVKA